MKSLVRKLRKLRYGTIKCNLCSAENMREEMLAMMKEKIYGIFISFFLLTLRFEAESSFKSSGGFFVWNVNNFEE